jgi:hypothetical protein
VRSLAYDVQHGTNSFMSGKDGAKSRATRRNGEERLKDLARMRQLLAEEAANEKAAACVCTADAAPVLHAMAKASPFQRTTARPGEAYSASVAAPRPGRHHGHD